MKRTPAWTSKDGGFHRHRHDAEKADAEHDVFMWAEKLDRQLDGGVAFDHYRALATALFEGASELVPLLTAYVKADHACQVANKEVQLAELVDEVAKDEAADPDLLEALRDAAGLGKGGAA